MQFINSLVSSLLPQAQETYSSFLQPYDSNQVQQMFQQSFVDPAMMQYEQQVLPSIFQAFGDVNAGSSSALNQALASSAKDLSTALGSQFGSFAQNYRQQQLGALGQLGGLSGQRILDPIVQQGYNPTGDYIKAGSQLGAAALPFILSDPSTKENVKTFERDTVKDIEDMKFYEYNYKQETGIGGDWIGLMSDEVPDIYTVEEDGYRKINLYSLVTASLKAIRQLNEKIHELEENLREKHL